MWLKRLLILSLSSCKLIFDFVMQVLLYKSRISCICNACHVKRFICWRMNFKCGEILFYIHCDTADYTGRICYFLFCDIQDVLMLFHLFSESSKRMWVRVILKCRTSSGLRFEMCGRTFYQSLGCWINHRDN